MTRSIEIEMKFEILDPEQLEQFLKGATYAGQKQVVDVYLDTPAGKMFKRGIFIRIRDETRLDFKFNREDIAKGLADPIDHLHCDEVSITLPLTSESLATLNDTISSLGMVTIDSPTLDAFISANKLVKSITIDKQRRSYEGGGFHIDVDSIQGLGEYLEIEKMTDEHADSKKILSDMNKYLRGLQLQYIDTGYNELYWRKHNFDLYLQGKYLLPEDRKKYRAQSVKT